MYCWGKILFLQTHSLLCWGGKNKKKKEAPFFLAIVQTRYPYDYTIHFGVKVLSERLND